jgi:tetratricopeptide (TPR) repeat protein
LAKAYAEGYESISDLAASWQERLREAQDRYHNVDSRHLTLAACFEYSYLTLPPEAKDLFSKLTILTAPFLADIVQRVFSMPRAGELLNLLFRKSLLQCQEVVEGLSFYFFHPMVRWYAEEQVKGVDFGPLKMAMALAYLDIAHNTYDKLDPLNSLSARVMLPDLERALGFLPDKEWSRLAFYLGWLLRIFGEPDQAMELYQEALRMFEQVGDIRGKGATLHAIANILQVRGAPDRAMKLYQEALRIFEQVGDLQGKGAILREMAHIPEVQGELEQAMDLYQEALLIFEQLGKLLDRGATLHAIANIHRVRGQLEQAMELYREALRIVEQVGDLRGRGETLREMAHILQVRGELERAMELYREALRIVEQVEVLQGKGAILHWMATIHKVRGELEQAMELCREALCIVDELRDLQGKGAVLALRGQLLAAAGKKELALTDFVEAMETLARISARDAQQVVEMIQELRTHIGDEEFNALWRKVTGQQELPEWLAEPQRTRIERLLTLANRREEARDWRAAVETYGEALSLLASRTMSDEEKRRHAETALRIGVCLRHDGQWGPSVDRLQEAFRLFKSMKDFRGQGLTYLEIARAYQAMNSYDLAMLYYKDAARLFKRASDMAMAGAAHEEAGNLQVYLRAFPGAIVDLEEAARLYREAQISSRVAIVDQNLGLARQAQE